MSARNGDTGEQIRQASAEAVDRASGFLRSAIFFRVWVIWGGPLVLLIALRNLHELGWGAQPVFLGLIGVLAVTGGRDVCARCAYYNTWHCGGAGRLAARFFPSLDGPIPRDQLIVHGVLFALVALGTLHGLYLAGAAWGAFGVGWMVLAGVASVPSRRPFSWLHGRDEAHAMALELARTGAADRRRAEHERAERARGRGGAAARRRRGASSRGAGGR